MSIFVSSLSLLSGFRIAAIKKQNRNKRADDAASPDDHVVGDVDKSSPDFSVGDGQTYGGYSNPPLTEGDEYDIYVAYVSKTPDVSTYCGF